ncbi:MAG TPA: sulfotransferase domain-containing protein [Verrucomicrobiae bacterium]|jgi:lipopolysaccharide transport system ATP-binding protein|nr:sulfotransferase domain-containing protein [Verrucomicrobiae bacterium]
MRAILPALAALVSASLSRPTIKETNLSAPAMFRIPAGATLLHVTHWKAASQWIRALLNDAFGSAVLEPEKYRAQLWREPLRADAVYPCVCLDYFEFAALELPEDSRRFVVIRDLRDTLISAYFSLKFSHPLSGPDLSKNRLILSSLNEEEGLIYLMERWLPAAAAVQRTWLRRGEDCFKLEDLAADPVPALEKIFRDHFRISATTEQLQTLADRHSFSSLSGGRRPGVEDVHSHYRKGVAGDWREHFTPKISDRFQRLYADTLELGGYA